MDEDVTAKELRMLADEVFLSMKVGEANALSGKLIVAARTIEKMRERERRCPTMLESESRALLKGIQEIAEAVGVDGNTSSVRQVVNAVRDLAKKVNR